MAMVVRTNYSALNATRHLNKNQSGVAGSIEKLSSGFKVNRAADDASGLAISEKMKAQIKALETAVTNAEDGIGLIQTTEGYLDSIHTMLNRMVTLSEKAANGIMQTGEIGDSTNKAYGANVGVVKGSSFNATDKLELSAPDRAAMTDRDSLQAEMDQLCAEIDRVAATANFNKVKLFDGNLATKDYDKISQPGVKNPTITNSSKAIADIAAKIDATVKAFDAALAPAKTTYKNALDALELTVNTDKAAVATAQLAANQETALNALGAAFVNAYNGAANGVLTNALVEAEIATLFADTSSDLGKAFAAYNTALVANSGTALTTLAQAQSAVSLTALSGTTVPPDGVSGQTYTDVTTAATALSGAKTTLIASETALKAGKVTQMLAFNSAIAALNVNAVSGDAATKIDFAAAFAKLTDTTGEKVYDLVMNNGAQGTYGGLTGDNGYTTVIGKAITDVLKDAGYSFKAEKEDFFVQGGQYEGQTLFTINGFSVDQSNLTLFRTEGTKTATSNTLGQGLTLQIGETSNAADKLIMNVGRMNTDTLFANITDYANNDGLKEIKMDVNSACTVKGVIGYTLNISTQKSASATAEGLNSVINKVSVQRAELGAMQNRLDYTIDNLNTAVENVTSANSRIRDTDMAKEMTKFTMQNVLLQSAQAMLAQANSQPQNVLSLLR